MAGAAVHILTYSDIAAPLGTLWSYGKPTLPDITQTPAAAWVLPIVLIGGFVLFLTRPRPSAEPKAPAGDREETEA